MVMRSPISERISGLRNNDGKEKEHSYAGVMICCLGELMWSLLQEETRLCRRVEWRRPIFP
jgi:hypothetical protein